jgi:hypothetical protein
MTTQLLSTLSKGLHRNVGIEYNETPRKSDMLFHREDVDTRYIDTQLWEGYPLPVQRNPGEPYGSGSFAESFNMRHIICNYGIMDQIPEEDVDDDLYGVVHKMIPRQGGAIARAFSTNEEMLGALFFSASGYDTTATRPTVDGVCLFSTAHPVSLNQSGTTVANRPSSEMDVGLAAAEWAQINLTTQYAANRVEILDNEIAYWVVHPNKYRVSKQVWQTDTEYDTTDRAVNVMTEFKTKIVKWPYFQKSGSTGTYNAWFAIGRTHQLRKLVRKGFRIRMDNILLNGSYVWVADSRFVYGADDWRGTCGSIGG